MSPRRGREYWTGIVADLEASGLTHEQFAVAVGHAPATRPERYTILERLAMSQAEVAQRVEDYVRAVAG